MLPVLYSHRLKTVLQHTVRDLGLTLVLDDQQSDLDLSANEATIRETAGMMRVKVDFETSDSGTTITFYA